MLLSALPLSSVAASLLSPGRSCCWGLSCPRYLQRDPGSRAAPFSCSLEGDRRAQPSLRSCDPSPCCSGTRDNELRGEPGGEGRGRGSVPVVSSENNKTQRGPGGSSLFLASFNLLLKRVVLKCAKPAWLGSSKVKWAEQGVPLQQEGAAWAVPSPPALRGMERSGVPPAASHSPIRCAPLCSQPTPGESRNPSGASGAAVLACAGGGPVPKIAV